MMPPTRCDWARTDRSIEYHDREWGVPKRDDPTLFEFLILEGAQAGLSWETILKKRDGYRRAFAGFDAAKVARFSGRRIEGLLADPGIVRNRLKVESAVANARAFLLVQKEFGSFGDYLWGFTEGRPIVNRFRRHSDIPAETPLSRQITGDLRTRGFRFVGPTIMYAYMQAIGMVNDHLTGCFRHGEIG